MGFPDSPDGIPSSIADDTLNSTAALHVLSSSTHRPSMLLDAEKGKPIEVEVILGEVVRMAKERGMSLPVSFVGTIRMQVLTLQTLMYYMQSASRCCMRFWLLFRIKY
jgi:ketopantoate reductase